MDKRLTRQQAIEKHCKDCIYDKNAAGTWKQQTEACTHKPCALYPYRPKSAAKVDKTAPQTQNEV